MAAAPFHASMAAGQPETSCPHKLFGVAAQIVRIEPRDGQVSVKSAEGRRSIGIDGLVCSGESLELLLGGAVTKVDLLVQGKKQTLVPPQGFNSADGALAFASQALAYLSDVVQGSRSLKSAPDIPIPTAARGSAPDPTPPGQIRAMRLLQDLPRQKILATTKPVISWRDGAGPYTCQNTSDDGTVLSDTQIDKIASWCPLKVDAAKSDQLVVVDARGQFQAWNVRIVSLADVPRPEWLPAQPLLPSPADQTAWALWLWRSTDKTWRLQALGMLNDLSPNVWMAGYLRNNLLAENEKFSD